MPGETGLDVLATGPLATVQDLGRPGLAHLGVPVGGAADRAALRLANRLVGNVEGAAGIEVTFGGLALRVRGRVCVALTGAPGDLLVDGRAVGGNHALWLDDGTQLQVGAPDAGIRSYLAVRGGLDVARVLGSRSTDLLSGFGEPLRVDDVLPVGPAPEQPVPALDVAAVARPASGEVRLRAVPGPRHDWLSADSLAELWARPWTVSDRSNRIGIRLDGPALRLARTDELPSEGAVPGSLQVPANGQPVLFLVDHPVTGGYPVAAVVLDADLDRAGQLRPGQQVRLRRAPAVNL